MQKKSLSRTKNGFLSFFANAPTMQIERKPHVCKSEYLELSKDYVTVLEYAELKDLNIHSVKTAIGRGKIPFKTSRRKRYIDINFEYKEGLLQYLDLLEDMEAEFSKCRSYTETGQTLGIPAQTVRGYLKIFLEDNPAITLKKKRNNLKYSDQDVIEFKKLYKEIGVYKHTAQKLGIRESTLRKIILTR